MSKDCIGDYDYKNWIISWSDSGWRIDCYEFDEEETENFKSLGLRFKTIKNAKSYIDKIENKRMYILK